MLFIFDIQEEWTWNISNNYIIKSDVYIKLKYIHLWYRSIHTSLDIYQHTSYHAESKKKEEINMLAMNTHLMSNK